MSDSGVEAFDAIVIGAGMGGICAAAHRMGHSALEARQHQREMLPNSAWPGAGCRSTVVTINNINISTESTSAARLDKV